MEQTTCVCLYNRSISPGYYRMGISSSDLYADSRAGQFVMVGVPDSGVPFLRRPFSIHGIIGSGGGVTGIEILYKVIGLGTQRLAACHAGDPISLLGPLGKGFTLSPEYRKIFIVAGGIGVAPLVFLFRRIRESGTALDKCEVFLGGRSESDILCQDIFLDTGCKVHLTTDDGSLGDQCLVTQPVEQALAAGVPDMMYACGPEPMLKCLSGYALRYKIPCEVSVETLMACGVGACLGCAVPHPMDPNRYIHVCKDGPVFDSRKIY